MSRGRRTTLWRTYARRACLLLAAWPAAHAGYMLLDGLLDRGHAADACVVLGNQVLPPGVPSPRLKARLDLAFALHRQGRCPLLIVSGGTGVEGFDEAAVMAAYLTGLGALPERVLQDPDGVTTRATAKRSRALLRERELRAVLVVTQYFHVTRSKLAFRQAGVPVVRGAGARFFELRDLYSIPREVVAFYAYLLRPLGDSSGGADDEAAATLP